MKLLDDNYHSFSVRKIDCYYIDPNIGLMTDYCDSLG